MASGLMLFFWTLSLSLAVLLAVFVFLYIRQRRKPGISQRFDTRLSKIVGSELEEKIRLSKKQLETAFDAIADMICVIDTSLTVSRVNKSYAGKTGNSVKELPGVKCYAAFFNRTAECEDCPARVTIKTGEASKKAVVRQRIKDDEKMFEINTFAVTGADGRVVNVIEHIRDVSLERRINEQLIRAEKLAGIGIMTAGIAHEMNNPLSGISGTAVNLLKTPEKYGLNEKGADRISIILECATRATMIMKDLLRFSQKQDVVRIPTDFSLLVSRVVSGVKPPGSSKIKRSFDIPSNLPKVRCDPVKVEQVILHIANNAVWAVMERRKESSIDGKPLQNEEITVSARQSGEDVIVDFVDNGIGIPKDVEARIFDPFFTTRAPGEGTGLGLSICHRIMEEHQGSIRAFSENGLTTVRLLFPIGFDPWENRAARTGLREGGVNV